MARIGIFICGVLLSFSFSGGLVYLVWAFVLKMVQNSGRNTSMDQIFLALFLLLSLIIVIPWAHFYYYTRFKRAGYPVLAKGLISGLFGMIAGGLSFYLVEQFEKNQAMAPHSEEYLNYQRDLFLEAERKKVADSLEVANAEKAILDRRDSLKSIQESIRQERRNKKDWEKVMQ